MRAALALWLMLMATPVMAVQPDEILPDPALETRARDISRELRCPVCQGETIDESNAPISRDLRLYVRERLVAGDTNDQVLDAVTQRYGEFVLFNPKATGGNIVLYLTAPILLLIGAVGVLLYLRRRRTPAATNDLTAAEQARLTEIMRDR
ncbi:MAG: cytochrome C biogenesis protein CcdA [Paracoccus denitrificans]|nr:MAG: cytochrome C biogenesis protein CcdA [Paracoccus denitrificans]PZO84159.1 MAG: cytochrome C biogenesis protein CcdA [Paracoccus denitrificans]